MIWAHFVTLSVTNCTQHQMSAFLDYVRLYT